MKRPVKERNVTRKKNLRIYTVINAVLIFFALIALLTIENQVNDYKNEPEVPQLKKSGFSATR